MKIKSLFLICCLILISLKNFSQIYFNSNIACNYNGDSKKVSNYYGKVPFDVQADFVVKKIMNQIGLPPNFKVISGDVPNAAAVCILNKYTGNLERFIIYNTNFMSAVVDNLNDWAAISIIAHEIGHHLSGHSLELGGSRPKLELEADRFSGFILKRMGASLVQAQLALNSLTTEAISTTHPPKSLRLIAVQEGWNSTNSGINEKSIINNLEESSISSNTSYIPITLTPLKNCWVYLGSYYGNGKTLVDSTWLDDNSKGVFKKDTKFTCGIYFIVSPQYTIQFELLMDKNQHFSIIADSAQKEKVQIVGSNDNDIFMSYSALSASKRNQRYNLELNLKKAKKTSEINKINSEITAIDKERQDYIDNVIQKYPYSLLAMLLSVMQRPKVPEIPTINNKPDSLYPFRYVKNHYWDNVGFNDDRLLRTPFFEPKLDEYFKFYVSPEPDSLINEIQYMLLMARGTRELYTHLLVKFTNKYVNPEFMGQDKVFLYLFNEFWSKGDTTFLNPASRKMIFDRAYSIIANQIGNPAPEINLKNINGKNTSLYSINAKFTIVAFWDPNSGYCKEQIPRIDSMYKAKWKALGLKVYSVYVYDDNLPAWKKFINEKELFDWTHVYKTKAARDLEVKNNQPGFRQLYDVRVIPTIYLLDEKKRIIAKQLSLEQFDQIIDKKK